ncbi:MAG: alkaline phosphatase family protein [Bifidobacteriaceae bacterium]|nr:alkaline phosphatase family protein [Bifidobacteriaceae bacterium]
MPPELAVTRPPDPPLKPEWVTVPRYGPGSLAAVLPGLIRRLGIDLPPAKDGPDLAGQSVGLSAREGAKEARRQLPRGIVLILADGLGSANLEGRRGHAPFCSAQPRSDLVCGFPSTTVASLASLGTGLPPGETALAGYSLRDPATGARTNLIKWDTPTPPRRWQPHETIFERLDRAGHPAAFVGEGRFADSAMTQSSLRGARFYPADKRADAIVAASLAAARANDGLVYTYWGALDKIGHSAGWESAAWSRALEELDGAARRLAAELPKGWELWLTADHGMVDVTGAPVWDVAKDSELAEGVTMVAGEARAVHLYCPQSAGPAGQADGRGADSSTAASAASAATQASVAAVAARWRHRLGAAAWVLTKAEAVAAGLFGSVDQRVWPYLGDVIVALAGRGTVLDSAVSPDTAKMVGQHGSLTAAEMRVPLIRFCPP